MKKYFLFLINILFLTISRKTDYEIKLPLNSVICFYSFIIPCSGFKLYAFRRFSGKLSCQQ